MRGVVVRVAMLRRREGVRCYRYRVAADTVRDWDSGTGTGPAGLVVLSRGIGGEGEGALRRKNLLARALAAAATLLTMTTASLGVVVVASWRFR